MRIDPPAKLMPSWDLTKKEEVVKKEIYGCACCNPEFGKIFNGNKTVADLSTMNPSEVLLERNHTFRESKLDRRTFLKGSLVAAGTAALVPGLAGCTQASKEATTVFTGGTVLTVDGEFSQAEALAIRGTKSSLLAQLRKYAPLQARMRTSSTSRARLSSQDSLIRIPTSSPVR